MKEEMARPTRWFLKEYCGVESFLDDSSTTLGTEKTMAMLEAAYRCTHALVVLSPSFRTRKYCVQELNTFVSRDKQEPQFRVIPALWWLPDTRGYAPVVHNKIWLKVANDAAPQFMIYSLWPRLLQELRKEPMEPLALEEALVKYVTEHRGRTQPIPPCLESFVQGSDIPREIIFRRYSQWDSRSDMGSMRDLASTLGSSTRALGSRSSSITKEETLRYRFIKQFWKLESATYVGKLVQIVGTVSKFAPFTIGAPWLKAKSHLKERKAMDAGDYEPSQTAKANAKLAVTAGQMVLRAGEFKSFQGYRYFGLYQAIVRNSIPLFVTNDYYDELHQIFQDHDVDAFDGMVVGRIIELPTQFVAAFADYVDEKVDVRTGVRRLKGKKLCGIEIGGEGTSIEYIQPTLYLDGDIWVAASQRGVTSFKSRFCNLADRDDLFVGINDLKEEVKVHDIVYQFDTVEKRFEDDEDEVDPLTQTDNRRECICIIS